MAETSTGSAGGLFAGLLSGTALCSVLFAVMSLVIPLETSSNVPAPEVSTLSDGAELSSSGVTEDNSPTISPSDAPSDDIALEAPTAEAPAEDRDSQTVALERPDDQEPVQTGTVELSGPDTTLSPTPEAAQAEPPAETAAPQPLETAETSVESDTPEVAEAPETPTVAPEQEADVQTAKVETPQQPAAAGSEMSVATLEAPQTGEAPSLNAQTATAPEDGSGPKAPEAPEVIALKDTPGNTPEASVQPPSLSGNDNGVALNQAPEQDSSPSIDTSSGENTIVLKDFEPESDTSPDAAETPSADSEQSSETEAVLSRPEPPVFNGDAFNEYAVAYQAPDDGPLLTIILEDVGDRGVSLQDLQTFMEPVTFAVATGAVDSRLREAAFREAGFEVVALAGSDNGPTFNQNSNLDNVAELLSEALLQVPGAVALVDTPKGDVYRNPRLVSNIATELGQTNRGLLIHEKFGVNRALEAAVSSGIPTQSILRVIDDNRDAANIRRALDRGALDASKSGAAIVYGRTYPETVAAILPWLLGSSARSVNLAPLTATMKRAGN